MYNYRRLSQVELTSNEKSLFKGTIKNLIPWLEQLKDNQCICWYVGFTEKSFVGSGSVQGYIFEKLDFNKYYFHATSFYPLTNKNMDTTKNGVYRTYHRNTRDVASEITKEFKRLKHFTETFRIFNRRQEAVQYIANNAKRLLKVM